MEAVGYYGTLSSVIVTSGTTNYTLEKDNDTFIYEPDEYSIQLPAEGTYTFSYTFTTGETYTTTDALTDDVLLPADITTSDYTNDKIKLEWDEIEDADAIYVQMKKADGDIVFRSITNSYLAGNETEYTISQASGTWDSSHTMTDGATYTVEIIALLADNAGSLQAMSIATTTVVWGVE